MSSDIEKQQNLFNKSAELRRRSEELMSRSHIQSPISPETMDYEHLVHELQVYQIELEMQNEELRLARLETETVLERYTELYDFAPLGYFKLGRNGKILQINLKGASLLGMGRALLMGKRIGLFVSVETFSVFNTFLDQVFNQQDKKSCEVSLQLANNTRIDVHMDAVVSKDGQTCNAVVSDITERKQTQIALQKSEQRFRHVLENSLDAAYRRNLVTNAYDYMSPAITSITGYTPQEMISMSLQTSLSLIHADERDKVVKAIDTALSAIGEPQLMEYRLKNKDGNYRWMSDRFRGVMDERDGTSYLIGNVRDITDQKESEEALRESEEKYHNVFATENDSIFLIDQETGAIQDVNDAACRLYGYTRAEMLQSRNIDMSAESDETARATREIPGRIPLRYHKKKDGTVFPVDISASTFQLKGRIVILAAIRDITNEKQMEANLVHAQKMVSLGTLIAGIAHELNTPLQIITGISESMAKNIEENGRLEGNRPQEQLKTINRNAWRMAEIVRMLQHYIQSGRGQAMKTDFNHLVESTLALIEYQLEPWAKIEIKTELAENLPPFLCDQSKISEMLINLFTNARDAMPDGGQITIKTDYLPENEQLVLVITDTGEGIPEEILARVFDPFVTTKPVGKGIGLGLSFVQGIVHAHGGEIKLESVRGKGTTVKITFPVSPSLHKAAIADDLATDKHLTRYGDSIP
ncbi:MAG: PAS domain S-box protein [Chloroflexota bacterium]